MRFEVLGPLRVLDDGAVVAVDTPMLRRVLAVLLCRPGQPVPADGLADAIWRGEVPPTGRKTLQVYIRRLRAAIGVDRVTHSASGYQLMVDPGEVDAQVFVELTERGRAARRADDQRLASDCFGEALSLWRGAAFADITGVTLVEHEAARLNERRLEVIEDRFAADLTRMDVHQQDLDTISELSLLVKDHPFRERLRELLMLALYRSGRQSEALTLYQVTRELLAAELGVDPGAALQRLHTAILRGDPRLDPPEAGSDSSAPAAGRDRRRPRQLPADVSDFTGRTAALNGLAALIGDEVPTAHVTVIGGAAGVGKTALAVHWAHQIADRFPDGLLYVNLHGYHSEPPLRPIDALTGFLRTLGVDPDGIPVDLDQLAARYRSELAGRRMLVLLDNAADVAQVRPLLPAAPGSLVLITSRDRLTGLVARDGARRLTLPAMAPQESAALIGSILGPARAGAEPDAVARLADSCDHLPLALRIAAATLSDQPDRSIAQHVAELRRGDRLTALAIPGDEHHAVGAAFDQSYATLDGAQRLLFRRLGLIPGPEVSIATAAAVAGCAPDDAARLIGRLTAGHLLDPRPDERYVLHDLLRAYAQARAEREDGRAVGAAATARVLAYYLHQVHAAARQLYPHLVRLAEPDGPQSTFDDPDAALAWLDLERANLLAAITQTGHPGGAQPTWLLADALRGYFWLGRRTVDWLAAANAALGAAASADDPYGQSSAHLSLGLVHFRLSEYGSAWGHYNAALSQARRVDWLPGQAAALDGLGSSLQWNRPAWEAADHYRQAMAINEQLGRTSAAASNLTNLSMALTAMGQARRAERNLTRAYEVHHRANSPSGQAITLCNLGEVYSVLGRLDEAEACASDALARCRQLGTANGEAMTLGVLATIHRDAGRNPEALAAAQAGLDLMRQTADRFGEAELLNTLGTIAEAMNEPAQAIAQHRQALDLARAIDARSQQAKALIGWAEAGRHLDPAASVHHAQQALTIARTLGYRLLEADAHTALAAAYLNADRPEPAHTHAARASARHGRTGRRLARIRARDLLTAAERPIADLSPDCP